MPAVLFATEQRDPWFVAGFSAAHHLKILLLQLAPNELSPRSLGSLLLRQPSVDVGMTKPPVFPQLIACQELCVVDILNAECPV